VGAIYVKNLVVFSTFSSSSWLGASIAEMATPREKDRAMFPAVVDDFERRIKAGEFSRSTELVESTDDVWTSWLSFAPDCVPSTSQPRVLCARYKADGSPNLNHLAVLTHSRDLGRDGRRAIALYPSYYGVHVKWAFEHFLTTPSWEFFLLAPSLERYSHFANLIFLYGESMRRRGSPQTEHWWSLKHYPTSSLPCAILVLSSILIIFYTAARELVCYWRGRVNQADWVFPAMVLALFLVVPNLVNGLETERMRYTLEPVMLVALCYGLAQLISRLRGRSAVAS
jgi:hypothetical protein